MTLHRSATTILRLRGARLRVPASRILALALALVVLALAAPAWSVTHFPSQDGPVHLANARILLEYRAPAPNILPEYFAINRQFDPNWSAHLLLTALLWCAPPAVAEKLLVTLFLLALPLALAWAVRPLGGRAALAAALTLPWLLGFPLHMGFYNFCLSLPAGWLLLGLWLRRRHAFGLGAQLGFTALALLTCFCHPFSLVLALLAIAATGMWSLLCETDAGTRAARAIDQLVRPAYAALPALLVLALFLVKQGLRTARDGPARPLLARLFPPEALVCFDAREALPATLAAALVLTGVAVALVLRLRAPRRLRPADALLGTALVVLALYAPTPDWLAGGGFLGPRLSLWLFLLLSAWVATQPLPRLLTALLGTGAAALTLCQAALLWPAYQALDQQVTELLSVTDRIPANTTLHPLILAGRGVALDGAPVALRVAPLLHAGNLVAAQRRVVSLDNYAAWQGYFPVVFRPERDPDRHLGRDHGQLLDPPRLDLLGYDRTGGRVEFVLTFGDLATHCDPLVRTQLEQHYRLLCTSTPRGLARLYQRVP